MSAKLILAEALDVLRAAEEAERIADRLQLPAAQNGKGGAASALIAAKRQYSIAYDTYLRGLELLNYCRRQGIDSNAAELIQFCSSRMVAYMNRCDELRDKEANILTPVDQAADRLDKQGFTVGSTLFAKRQPLKQKSPICFESTLQEGAYQVIVRNLDRPGMARPEVVAVVVAQGSTGKTVKYEKMIPPFCAWSRYIGLVSSGNVRIAITTTAWMQSAEVEVVFRELSPAAVSPHAEPGPLPTNWVDTLPELPPLEANPAGESGRQSSPAAAAVAGRPSSPAAVAGEAGCFRLELPTLQLVNYKPLDAADTAQRTAFLRGIVQTYFDPDPHTATPSSPTKLTPVVSFVDTISALPDPTPLLDDMSGEGIDFQDVLDDFH